MADLASELHDGEYSEGVSLCTCRACVKVSLQLWAHSTAVLIRRISFLGSPSMLGHHQVCLTRLYYYENMCFKLCVFFLHLFPITGRLYF